MCVCVDRQSKYGQVLTIVEMEWWVTGIYYTTHSIFL